MKSKKGRNSIKRRRVSKRRISRKRRKSSRFPSRSIKSRWKTTKHKKKKIAAALALLGLVFVGGGGVKKWAQGNPHSRPPPDWEGKLEPNSWGHPNNSVSSSGSSSAGGVGSTRKSTRATQPNWKMEPD